MNLLRVLQQLLYDGTIGVAREFQQKTMELARLTAALCYIKSVKSLRMVALTLCVVVLASAMLAMALVLVPIILVLLTPWSLTHKVIGLLVLGILDVGAALIVLMNIFSEKCWMKITRSKEFVSDILNS